MRCTARTLIVAALLSGLGAVAGCSSSDSTSGTTIDEATPDGSFCSLLVAFRATNQTFEAEFNSGDPARAEAVMTELVSQSDLLRRKAPSDIRADVSIVAGYLTSLDTLMADNDYDVDQVVEDEAASGEFLALTTEEVDSSLLQLRTYADTTCAPTGASSTTALAG